MRIQKFLQVLQAQRPCIHSTDGQDRLWPPRSLFLNDLFHPYGVPPTVAPALVLTAAPSEQVHSGDPPALLDERHAGLHDPSAQEVLQDVVSEAAWESLAEETARHQLLQLRLEQVRLADPVHAVLGGQEQIGPLQHVTHEHLLRHSPHLNHRPRDHSCILRLKKQATSYTNRSDGQRQNVRLADHVPVIIKCRRLCSSLGQEKDASASIPLP
mmetsp:Transcript_38793/g.69415  ORF Transcript_38793/g.69415 Transcript_38793/m.69415 type:complete len:213 (+) Transcript_38793:304-942(+)